MKHTKNLVQVLILVFLMTTIQCSKVEETGVQSGVISVSPAQKVISSPAPTYNLSVGMTPSGAGTVRSREGGIRCGSGESVCSKEYGEGTEVILDASAGTGFVFTSWESCPEHRPDGSCDIIMTDAVNVAAKFATMTATGPTMHKVTVDIAGSGAGGVTSEPPGIACSNGDLSGTDITNDCEEDFEEGTTVQLVETAFPGVSTFAGWGLDCSDSRTGTTCRIDNISGPKTVKASFGAIDVQAKELTISISGRGRVSTEPASEECISTDTASCVKSFVRGTVLRLVGLTDPSYDPVVWGSSGCREITADNKCVVELIDHRSVTAIFRISGPDAPHILSTDPIHDATNVDISVRISATFSEPMDPATINDRTFVVHDNSGTSVAGTVSLSGSVATFTPSFELLPMAAYSATITTGARDLTGVPLSPGNHIWSFTTVDGRWTSFPIDTSSTNTSFPDVVADDKGNMLVTWKQRYDVLSDTYRIYAKTYVRNNDASYRTTRDNVIHTAGASAIAYPASNNSERSSLIVWNDLDTVDGRHKIYGAWYDVKRGRVIGDTQQIAVVGPASTSLTPPKAAIDPLGNSIVLWTKKEGADKHLYYDRFAGSWSSVAKVENVSGEAYPFSIAVDNAGNAIAVWKHLAYGQYAIIANRYAPDSGWERNLTFLDDSLSHEALHTSPQMAMNSAGKTLVVWNKPVGSRMDLYSIFFNGSSWEPMVYSESEGIWQTSPVPVENNEVQSVVYPAVAIDSNGNALAVWKQETGPQTFIYATRYDAALKRWDSLPVIISAGDETPRVPLLAMDGRGNAVAVWTATDTTNSNDYIYANRYIAGRGWDATPCLVHTAVRGGTSAAVITSPELAVGAIGNAMVVWQQLDGALRKIYGARFDLQGPLAIAPGLKIRRSGPSLDRSRVPF